MRCKIPICNKCSVFEENEYVEGWRASRSVAYCKGSDRELKRPTQGLMLSEEQSIGSFRSNEKNQVKIFYHDIISIFMGIFVVFSV